MKNLKLKSLLVVLLSLVTLGVQAQQDPDPLSTSTTDKVEVTYQDYLKMQDDYLKGKVSKEKLLKVFNQLTEEWDELCNPQHERVVPKTNNEVTATPEPVFLNGFALKLNDTKNKDLAKN